MHSALLAERTIPGLRRLLGRDVAQPAREHHLRLVVEVTAQGVGPDAGGPQQLRRAQGVPAHHHIAGRHLVGFAAAAVLDFDAGSPAVLHQHPGHQRLVKEFKRRVLPGRLPHDDVGA